MSDVVVVGSLSQDLVVTAARRPAKGETLRGTGFGMFAGGKGNNQALAAARAGAKVTMVGRVGNDAFGTMLLDKLTTNNISTEFMTVDHSAGTGIAHITVDGDGDNYIIIAQQANLNLSPFDVERASDVIDKARVLLMQLEVRTDTVIAAAQRARKAGVHVILNPAPAPENGLLPPELLQNVDTLVPNQTEAELLVKMPVRDVAEAAKAAQALIQLGPKLVIITMGEQGAFVSDGKESSLIPSFPVKAIDTTAAGDAFCGGLAAALSQGKPVGMAIRYGCACGALATTKMGAEPSLPALSEIEKLLGAPVS
jgi:ribokinase